jgi:hypothetical protein
VSRAARRRRRERVLRALLTVDPKRAGSGGGKPRREAPPGSSCCPPWLAPAGQDAGQPRSQSADEPLPGAPPPPVPPAAGLASPQAGSGEEPDPLADLRQARGWIDQLDERALWALLIRVRWPHGPACPGCGERDLCYLHCLDPDYRRGLGRWQCQVCAQAGDPGEGGTFTPLTGTLLDGMRFDIRSLWFMVEMFADGKASVETSEEARVNRHTSDRLFRLFRAAIYQTRSTEPIALGPEDVAEFDEVYITAGLKGGAGGLTLEREARPRGLKRRGRGDWDSDRLPVFGLLCRGGQVRLFVLRNVQTTTIRPIVEQMVKRGARVYTDSAMLASLHLSLSLRSRLSTPDGQSQRRRVRPGPGWRRAVRGPLQHHGMHLVLVAADGPYLSRHL